MLVLSRKSEEAVMVGGSVGFERVLKIIVLQIDNGRVVLGFALVGSAGRRSGGVSSD